MKNSRANFLIKIQIRCWYINKKGSFFSAALCTYLNTIPSILQSCLDVNRRQWA